MEESSLILISLMISSLIFKGPTDFQELIIFHKDKLLLFTWVTKTSRILSSAQTVSKSRNQNSDLQKATKDAIEDQTEIAYEFLVSNMTAMMDTKARNSRARGVPAYHVFTSEKNAWLALWDLEEARAKEECDADPGLSHREEHVESMLDY